MISMRTTLSALLAFSLATQAAAIEIRASGIDAVIGDSLRSLGLSPDQKPAAPPPPSAPGKLAPGQEDETQLPAEEQQANFTYGEISNRLKKLVIGRGKKRMAARKVNGVTVADRVKDGGIKYIVVHSAMGACNGAINQMETHHAAAHFIVCKDGSVTRLVDIKNITLHVKNETVNAASVGIETETGRTVIKSIKTKKGTKREAVGEFLVDDWDPAARWRMYSSLAWLIRAVAEEAHVTREWTGNGAGIAPGIISHLEADRGIPDAHTDPGQFFYSHVYPDFETRFPGQNMTPQKFLMLLVKADQAPKITKLILKTGTILRVADVAHAGLAKIIITGIDPIQVQTWLAPEQGMPPDSVDLPEPTKPGAYRIKAYDLVGNRTEAIFKVASWPGQTGELVNPLELPLPPLAADTSQ